MTAIPENLAVVIMGPTASGKTELAAIIAKECGGEIISADSRQVYKFLSAGTSKPEGKWTMLDNRSVYLVDTVPRHLSDFLDPRTVYDAGRFATEAGEISAGICCRGKRTVFEGGTGLYIHAYWNGLDPLPRADAALRSRLERFALENGRAALHARLAEADPEAARNIPPNNIQRVTRALEVWELTGTPISRFWTRKFRGTLPTHKAVFAVLDWNRSLLHDRIRERTNSVFDRWGEETHALLEKGYPEDCPGLKSLGYPQMIDFLAGRLTRAQAAHRIITLTNAYAKRQTTWFRQYKNALRIRIEKPEDWDTASVAGRIMNAK
ncbi:MAG: tRNA (adenosine(37)-N6)-dimethylallyltransferase MiaA [bacterium]